MKNKLILLMALLIAACDQGTRSIDPLLAQSEYSVLMFLAPDCPLCLTFTKPFNTLAEDYEGVQFIGILSSDAYSEAEVEEFRYKAGFDKLILNDAELHIARRFGANVTPEFILVDRTGKVLYKGLLDDRMERLGVYKQHWDRHYLRSALSAVQEGREVEVTETDAVGCVLEY